MLSDVYYAGSETNKTAIWIGNNNDYFINSNWHYNITTKGDIDGTGVVDLSDVNNIARYFAGWDVDCNEAALDVDGDGLVNLNDLIHLAQYVAGWEGIELY